MENARKCYRMIGVFKYVIDGGAPLLNDACVWMVVVAAGHLTFFACRWRTGSANGGDSTAGSEIRNGQGGCCENSFDA